MRISKKQLVDKYLGYPLIAVLLPVTRLLGMVLNRNHKLDAPPKNILFIKILGLGSLVVALDSISAIKKKYPDARFILLTDSVIAEGIQPFNIFDEIWTIDSKTFLRVVSCSIKYLFKSWKLSGLWVIDLEVYSKLTTLFSLFTLAINRFGFQLIPVYFRKYINTHNIYFNQFLCLEDNYISMCEAATNEKKTDYPKQSIYTEKRENEAGKPYIALNNTCSDLAPVRKMTDDTLLGICAWLIDNTQYQIALLGAPSDQQTNEHFIINKLTPSQRKRVINYAENKSFKNYYDFLYREVAFIVSVDSAPLHIAKKLGLPGISLWGPTNPGSYLKIHEHEKHRHLFHYLDIPCSPCVHHTTSPLCGGNNTCMKNMDLITITASIKKLTATLEQHD